MEENANDYCLVGSCTDVGRVRKANEDSMDWFDCATGRVVVVCDGMGGHVGGQVASQTAIKAIRDFLTVNTFDSPDEAITNAIITANQAILQEAQKRPELAGMGSTCVMLVIKNGVVYYGHVGDSRIYFVANHRIVQLTKDQSYVQTLVDAGVISQSEAEHHPRKNEITNALGLKGMTPPIVCETPVLPEAGNCFVLCSDGLSGMISDSQIEHIVSRHDVDIAKRAADLVSKANEAGGKDNITVQLVEFTVTVEDSAHPAASGDVKPNPKPDKKRLLLIGVAALVVIIVAIVAFSKGGGGEDSAAGSDSIKNDTVKNIISNVVASIDRNAEAGTGIDTLNATIIEGDRVEWSKSANNRLEVNLASVVGLEYKETDKFVVDSKSAKGVKFSGISADNKYIVFFDVSDNKLDHFIVNLTTSGHYYTFDITIPERTKPKSSVEVPNGNAITPTPKPAQQPEITVPETPKPDTPLVENDKPGIRQSEGENPDGIEPKGQEGNPGGEAGNDTEIDGFA